jgi:hypothetical protein
MANSVDAASARSLSRVESVKGTRTTSLGSCHLGLTVHKECFRENLLSNCFYLLATHCSVLSSLSTQVFLLIMEEMATKKTDESNASFISRLKNTIFARSPSSSIAEPRPRGLKIPSYPVSQYEHPLKFGPPNGYETVCTSCHAINSCTFDNPYPQVPYVWHNVPGNHGRYPDIWCMSCKSKNSIPYYTGGPLQRQTQTARRIEQGNKESIAPSNEGEDVEPEEQPPPSYVKIPPNWTDAWAANRVPFEYSESKPDLPLITDSGITSSLFSFAKQNGKGD